MKQPNWKKWEKYKDEMGLLETEQAREDWEVYQKILEEDSKAEEKEERKKKHEKRYKTRRR